MNYHQYLFCQTIARKARGAEIDLRKHAGKMPQPATPQQIEAAAKALDEIADIANQILAMEEK